jgi:competence protein ComFC
MTRRVKPIAMDSPTTKITISNQVSMSRHLKIIWNWILDILYPKLCIGCGKEGMYLCKDCEIFLSEVDPLTLGVDGKTPSVVTSVWEYEGVMEKLIKKIKYEGCYDIVSELIDKVLQKIELNLPQDAVITFVPMFKKKERQRGFNQSEIIAKELGKRLNRPVVKLLKKIKDTPSQVGLNPQERMANVRNAFRLTLGVDGKTPSVLIVDDVYTTGATMGECIKTLKESGIKNVWGFTLSKTMNIQKPCAKLGRKRPSNYITRVFGMRRFSKIV